MGRNKGETWEPLKHQTKWTKRYQCSSVQLSYNMRTIVARKSTPYVLIVSSSSSAGPRPSIKWMLRRGSTRRIGPMSVDGRRFALVGADGRTRRASRRKLLRWQLALVERTFRALGRGLVDRGVGRLELRRRGPLLRCRLGRRLMSLREKSNGGHGRRVGRRRALLGERWGRRHGRRGECLRQQGFGRRLAGRVAARTGAEGAAGAMLAGARLVRRQQHQKEEQVREWNDAHYVPIVIHHHQPVNLKHTSLISYIVL